MHYIIPHKEKDLIEIRVYISACAHARSHTRSITREREALCMYCSPYRIASLSLRKYNGGISGVQRAAVAVALRGKRAFCYPLPLGNLHMSLAFCIYNIHVCGESTLCAAAPAAEISHSARERPIINCFACFQ